MSKEFPIVERLGGRTAVREILKARRVVIGRRGIAHWAQRGQINGGYIPVLMQVAEARGMAYSASDFIALPKDGQAFVSERKPDDEVA